MSDRETKDSRPVLAELFFGQNERTGLDALRAWFMKPVFCPAGAGTNAVRQRRLVKKPVFPDDIGQRLNLTSYASLPLGRLKGLSARAFAYCASGTARASKERLAMKTGWRSGSSLQRPSWKPIHLTFNQPRPRLKCEISMLDENLRTLVPARDRDFGMIRPRIDPDIGVSTQGVIHLSTGCTSQRSPWPRAGNKSLFRILPRPPPPHKTNVTNARGDLLGNYETTFGIHKTYRRYYVWWKAVWNGA